MNTHTEGNWWETPTRYDAGNIMALMGAQIGVALTCHMEAEITDVTPAAIARSASQITLAITGDNRVQRLAAQGFPAIYKGASVDAGEWTIDELPKPSDVLTTSTQEALCFAAKSVAKAYVEACLDADEVVSLKSSPVLVRRLVEDFLVSIRNGIKDDAIAHYGHKGWDSVSAALFKGLPHLPSYLLSDQHEESASEPSAPKPKG